MGNGQDSILGLDIGIASVGWSLIGLDSGVPNRIIAIGTRSFPMGIDLDESGKGTSRNLERRAARMRRRQLDRRAMRKSYVRHLLVKNNMAPSRNLDPAGWDAFERLNPYALRAKGIDHELSLFEFGRALYHLAQRRGFLSNRKSAPKKDEKIGEVKQKTESLEAEFRNAGCRTLGEFFSKQDPKLIRIRGQYTLRRWYIEEFDLLWKTQSGVHGDILTEDLRTRLYNAIFDQRPLKIKAASIGVCNLEKGKRRCRVAMLDAQRFRILQQLNNLKIETSIIDQRDLTPDERTKVLNCLETNAELKFSTARKLLGLKRTTKFNLERGGAETLKGDGTSHVIRQAIGATWDELDRAEREQLVNDLMSIDFPEVMKRRAASYWELNETQAEALSEVVLEEGYLAHSLAAIRMLLPHLEAGLPYTNAVLMAYPENAKWKPTDKVPRFPDLRNPLVQRALAETRRVVNAIVRTHGKPGRIRIEMARDMKKAAKDRENDWKQMRAREKQRAEAKRSIQLLKEYGIPDPKHYDVEKWLLFKECEGVCPYTGKCISEAALFGERPQFDIEHIIPFSRSLDDSFANKTLCHADYNRNVKKNRTPFEAAGGTADWEDIIKRVSGFGGHYKDSKLRKFLLENVGDEDGFLEDFTQRDLAVTRYATKAAYQAMSALYPPDEAKSRVQATQGKTTSYLRRAWRLNDILGLADQKTREDHRQHAVDATVIALTTPGTTKSLAQASVAGRAGAFKAIAEPWDGFKEDLRTAIQTITTSHRVSKKCNGPLHKETYYGIIKDPSDRKTNRAVVRKPVALLSAKDVVGDDIVDKAVREAVRSRLEELGQPDPAKAFKERTNHPCMPTKDGKSLPIHKVRLFQGYDPISIESNPGVRNVVLGNNHHVEFFVVKDKKGNPTFKGEVISQLDVLRLVAAARKAKVDPVVIRKQDESGNPLAFSLAIGELIEMDWKGERKVFVVQKLSDGDYTFREPNDARKAKDIPKNEVVRIQSDNTFRQTNPVKMMCDSLGRTFRTRD